MSSPTAAGNPSRTAPVTRGVDEPASAGSSAHAFQMDYAGPTLRIIGRVSGAGASVKPPVPPIHLSGERYVIGRASDADVRLESPTVAPHHALLTRVEDDYQLTDLDTHSGVYLNSVLVHSAVLRDRDVLQLGDVLLCFVER